MNDDGSTDGEGRCPFPHDQTASEEVAPAEAGSADLGRRRFLGLLGAGAAAGAVGIAGMEVASRDAGALFAKDDAWSWLRPKSRTPVPPASPVTGPCAAARSGMSDHFFGRMFELPAFAPPSDALTAALLDIGKPGGVLDAKDDLSKGPVALIIDRTLSVNNPDNPRMTAGVTFLGQFIDHDVTFDASSELNVPTDPRTTPNLRRPVLDLDSVYGLGPVASAHLYEPRDLAKLRLESGGKFEDVPRRDDNTAIIADPRNDEHVILSGIQAAFIAFHNRVVDHLRTSSTSMTPLRTYLEARRLVTWHYQWIVRNEFVPTVVGDALAGEIMRRGRRWYTPSTAVMPVEFQGAAFRMGHSMIRPSYRANLKGNDDGSAFFGLIFDPKGAPGPDPADLNGGFRAPRRFVGWQTFFDFGDGQVRPNKLLDTKLSSPLFMLPIEAIATRDLPQSLPQRNLLRHVTWSMPSGQAIAKAMGVPALSHRDLAELAPYGVGLERSTPLWYYVLKEAEVMSAGLHLGPVGGRIVGEVLIGLLQLDPMSQLNLEPKWKPTLPQRNGAVTGDFKMVDLLTFAGVDPTSRGQ